MPLSVAPVPPCQLSKWPPTITTSSALVVPGISPITLKPIRSSFWYSVSMSKVSFGVMPCWSRRQMRLYCSGVMAAIGGPTGSLGSCDPP